MKKVLTLLLIPFFADMLVACCDCDEPQFFKYTNSSLQVQNLDNRGQSAMPATGGIALKEAYGIRIKVHCETTASATVPFSFFLSSGYAFSCRCGEPVQYLAKDSITSLRIITINDFDTEHKAGSDITDHFKLNAGYYFISIADYLKQEAPVFYMEADKNTILDALLIQYPNQSGTHRFRIEMNLSDGRTLSQETDTIDLQ